VRPSVARKLSCAAPITGAITAAAAAFAAPQACVAAAAAATAAAVALGRKKGALAIPLIAGCAAAWLHAAASLLGWPRNPHPVSWSPAILGILCALAGQSCALARRPRRGRPILTVLNPRRYRVYRCHPGSDRAIAWVDVEADSYGRIRASDGSHHGIEQAFRERSPDPSRVLAAAARAMAEAGKSPVVAPSVETRLVSTAAAAVLTSVVLGLTGLPFAHTLAWASIAALCADQAAALFCLQKPAGVRFQGAEATLGEAIAACDPAAMQKAWEMSGQLPPPRAARSTRRAPAAE